jgi:dTDP-4-dehydrorhamnose reductase
LQWARQKETLRIVDDQISNPTWARMLAETTGLILARGMEYIEQRKGLYHITGGGYTSRLEWAKAILHLDPNRDGQILRELQPAKSLDFSTPAIKPLFSALECSKFSQTFDLRLPEWQQALQFAMQ